MKNVLFGLAWAVAAPALAQPVFFDDFDGNALLPHWRQPHPSFWQYNVSNGMLNVTDVLYPSHPKSPANFVNMGAPFAPQTDLDLDARMGWGSGGTVLQMDIILIANGLLVAHIGYRADLGGIFAAHSPNVVTIPAPSSGIFDFRVTRRDRFFSFFFEGNLFARLPSVYDGPINGLTFSFARSYPGEPVPFYVDRVRVVPSAGSLFGPAAALLLTFRRKRRLYL